MYCVFGKKKKNTTEKTAETIFHCNLQTCVQTKCFIK